MLYKVSFLIDNLANHLEAKGLLKEAEELDIVSNTIEAMSTESMAIGPGSNPIDRKNSQYELDFMEIMKSHEMEILRESENKIDDWIQQFPKKGLKGPGGGEINGFDNPPDNLSAHNVLEFSLSHIFDLDLQKLYKELQAFSGMKIPNSETLENIENILKKRYISKKWYSNTNFKFRFKNWESLRLGAELGLAIASEKEYEDLKNNKIGISELTFITWGKYAPPKSSPTNFWF